MALVKAAVCHEFGKPLSIQDVKLTGTAKHNVIVF